MCLTVICGNEESCVLVVVNMWRLAVQYGLGGDVAFKWVHAQPVSRVSQHGKPGGHTHHFHYSNCKTV